MLRKTILSLFIIAFIVALSPSVGSARGGFGGGGFHGGAGFHGSFGRGGGFAGGHRWRARAYGATGVGLGLATGYYAQAYDEGDGYPYGYGEYAEYGPWAYRGGYGGCSTAWKRVWTALGWRLRAVQLCD